MSRRLSPLARGLVAGALACAAVWGAARLVAPYWTAAALVTRAAGLHGPWLDRVVAPGRVTVRAEVGRLATRHGPVQARVFRPAGRARRAIVLAAGVNPRGLEEPRLSQFAAAIAERGFTVVTPALPDLMDFRITPRLTDQIEDAARWAAEGPAREAADGRVGLVGISFSGGLSIVAAARPGIRGRLAFVVSLGGHGDLPRTLRYLCTGILPDGTHRPAHDYGLSVILHNIADALVPRDQVEPLRHVLRTWLNASTVWMTDQVAGQRLFDEAARLAPALPDPARRLAMQSIGRDVAALGPQLAGHLPGWAGLPALSPERSPVPAAPVYLLHGTDDTVIPAMESLRLADDLQARGARVRTLVTPLVSHATVADAPGLRDVAALVAFWADVVRR
jgi:dienelactone hydrolase